MKPTPQERLRSAEWEVRDYDQRINYHDAEASRLRKVRQKYKGRVDRAHAAIARETAAANYEGKK